MKDARDIINHILENPSYKELRHRSECADFLQLLGLNHRRLIAFCYVRNNILFFALLHPLALAELKLDSNINMIKGLLKIYCKVHQNSKLAQISDIKMFVTKNLKFASPKFTQPKRQIFTYVEPSRGEFVNLAKEPQIYAKFEAIRHVIKANLAKENACY